MRRIKIGPKPAQLRQRFWGPSSPNPWTNSLFVGPPNHRAIDGTFRGQDRREHRAAINAWEDEGGSLAAAIANPSESRSAGAAEDLQRVRNFLERPQDHQ